MKLIIIEVRACAFCRHHRFKGDDKACDWGYPGRQERQIEQRVDVWGSFPSWCPLPDKQEGRSHEGLA